MEFKFIKLKKVMTVFYGIVSICKNTYGINKLKESEAFFDNALVIMDYDTYLSIPNIKSRINVVLTKDDLSKYSNIQDNLYFTDYENVYELLKQANLKVYENIYVIGCTNIFKDRIVKYFVTYYDKVFDKAYDDEAYDEAYDKAYYFHNLSKSFSLQKYSENKWSEEEQCFYRFLEYEKVEKEEECLTNYDEKYICLAKKVLKEEEVNHIREDRTYTGTLSIFGEQLSFNIENYVPLLTTKRVPWKSCIEELLWFMRGDTDATILKKKNVNIWNGNSSRDFLDKVGLNHLEEGDCGANYSFQWRYSGQKYENCKTEYIKKTQYDQINNIINLLKTDPFSRRIFLSAWNPQDLDKTVLPPCHVSAQFYVDNEKGLSCHMYQRSCDIFLGLPFNIFSYTVLTYILAKKCDLKPKRLIISLGDSHLYTNHINQIKTQIQREQLTSPKLILKDIIKTKEIEEINIEDFELIGYFPHPSIKAVMAV
jgi:thymidylate synthase